MKISEWVASSPMPKLNDAIVVNESCLILPDVELPFQHAEWINKCISEAKTRKIKTLVLPGDFAHWASMAHFPAAEKDVEQEVAAIEDCIGGFLHPFERVVYFKGNHDARPEKSLDRLISLERLSRLLIDSETSEEWNRKVEISDKYWCWVGEGEERWRIAHPKATGSVPGNPPRRMAQKLDCHFAMGHNHLVAIQQTDDGRHWGVEMGCCVDPERLRYVTERDGTHPAMKLGALILEKHGERFYPTLLSDGLFWFGK